MFTGVMHAGFNVQDMDRTIDFYVNKLGCQPLFSLKKEDGSIWLQYVRLAHEQYLEFFPADFEIKPAENASFHHIALLVDDMEQTCKDLKAKGVVIEKEPIKGACGCLQAWISDPDGNKIELMQFTEDSIQKIEENKIEGKCCNK